MIRRFWPAITLLASIVLLVPMGALAQSAPLVIANVSSVGRDGQITGTAYDPQTPETSIDVHFSVDRTAADAGGTFIGSVKANQPSPLLNLSGIPGNHKFTFLIPLAYRDGKQYTLWVRAIDTDGGGGVPVAGPITFTLSGGSPDTPLPKSDSLKYFGYYRPNEYAGQLDGPPPHLPLLSTASYANTIMTLDVPFIDRAAAAGLKGIINIQNQPFVDADWSRYMNTLLSDGVTTYKSKIQSAYEEGKVLALSFTDEAWLREYRNNAIKQAAQRVRDTFPNIPILYNEAYSTMDAKDPAFTFPTSVDWVSFDHYIYDPRKNDAWMKYYELMKSKRSRPDQKIFIVMNAWWQPGNRFSQEEMATVAKNYYELAKSDPDVIGINAWVWGGYEESSGWVGTRDLPQSVRDEHKRIGNEITGPRGQILGYAGRQTDGVINGWAVDYDTPEKSIDVHFYIDCPSTNSTDNCLFIGSTKADLPSPTINAEHGITAGKHRFNYRIPDSYLDSNGATKNLRDGRPHTLLIKGIDTGGNGGFLLNASYPFTFTLSGASSIPPTQNSLKYFGYYGVAPTNDGFSAVGNVVLQVEIADIDKTAQAGKKGSLNLSPCHFLTGGNCGLGTRQLNLSIWQDWLNASVDGKTRKQILENAYRDGKLVMLVFPDEPRFTLTNDEIGQIARQLKNDFPQIPIFLNESNRGILGRELIPNDRPLFGGEDTLIIPEQIDIVGTDRYGLLDPRKGQIWQKAHEVLKSKRSRPDQKIMLIMDAWWKPDHKLYSNLSKEDKAQVARNYFELAKSDPDVVGLAAWVWDGYALSDCADLNGDGTTDPATECTVGTRHLPQSVKDEHRRIADEIIKEPDLFIESIKTFPVREGASPKFKIKIKNQGKEAALVSNLGWSIDGSATSTAMAPPILAGARAVVKPQISWVSTAGIHKLILCADSDHAVIEGHNENNNCSKTEFVVEAATPPMGTDLFIQNVLIDSGIKVKIKNQGASAFVPTDLSKAVLLVDGVQNPDKKSMRALIPGAAKNFAWKNLALAPGIHSFSVCAWVGDSNNANNTNNCISGRFVAGKQTAQAIVRQLAEQARFTAKLSAGSKGAEVTKAQQLLKDEGYRIQNPTGTFDSLTASEVSELQADEDIPVTGVWGPDTIKAANEILGFEEDEPTPSPTPSPTLPPTNEQPVVTPPQTTPQVSPEPTSTPTPFPSQQIALSITEARFTGTPSLKINGAAKEFTFTLANSSNQILTGISYKAWIEQNGVKGNEVSKQITCGPGPGKVPATGCKEYGTISATSPLTTSGQAQAIFQIIDSTSAIITQTSIPVTLTGGTSAFSPNILTAIVQGISDTLRAALEEVGYLLFGL